MPPNMGIIMPYLGIAINWCDKGAQQRGRGGYDAELEGVVEVADALPSQFGFARIAASR